jgi:chorismate mutase / prephenate dehydratase
MHRDAAKAFTGISDRAHQQGHAMIRIVTLGPEGSHAWQAARRYNPEAEIITHPRIEAVLRSFREGKAELAVIPVYNTREGEGKEYFRTMEMVNKGYWIDNLVLPIQLSLGALDEHADLTLLVGTTQILRQCEDYIATRFPAVPLLAVQNLDPAMGEIKEGNLRSRGIIDSEEVLKGQGFVIREREVAPHNRTRFAVLGKTMAPATGYDATALITSPLKDRVGLLYDILGEFSRRGINLLDLRTESDVKSQKLQIYLELEGHLQEGPLAAVLERVERQVIQDTGVIRVLGSYPRVDMRPRRIRSFGFIGTGAMSEWFARKLENEGYRTMLTGRASKVPPEEMIPKVEVVAICVPISSTPATIEKFAPLLRDGQALLLLAGAAEDILETALVHTDPGVEVMLVHNLWGPQAATMKDKNVAVVRTARSGALCSEFEAFLYKHGADISHDTPGRHDLLMGVGQKLPTAISMAMALTLRENEVQPRDIGSHSTLTSLYGILAMARMHAQNPRTYAEILATHGEGRKIVRSFARNLEMVLDLADAGSIEEIGKLIESGRQHLTDDFLQATMRQSLAVDEVLGKMIKQ